MRWQYLSLLQQWDSYPLLVGIGKDYGTG